MTVVTQVTADASLDDLSTADYREMYVELRRLDGNPKDVISYDRFIAACGSTVSKAYWAQYNAGEAALNRKMRNDLRRAVGKKELPLTVAEAVGAASPDAAVWQVGEGVPQHVIMVGDDPVTIHVNETVQVVAQVATPDTRPYPEVFAELRERFGKYFNESMLDDMLPATPQSTVDARNAPPRPRRPCKRMWVTEAQQARLAALGDVSDSDIIEAGLRVWEAMPS